MTDLIGFAIGLAIGFVLGAVYIWRIWDRAIRDFEGDGEHDGSPWYRIARRIR